MAPEPDLERDTAAPTASSFDGPPPANLVKFRNLTGISTPVNITGDDRARPAKNIGIYSRVVAEEKKTHIQYHTMSSIIQLCFLGQIVVAATLTALGAANASHVVITILGAVNTVIAGLQTYLKGQGLPNRLRQYEFGLRKLREHIEDRERDFSAADCGLNVNYEIADIVAMYQVVRQTAEDNTPDTYLPMQGAGKKLLGQSDNSFTGVDGTGSGIGLSKNGQGNSVAEAGPSKLPLTPDATGQADDTRRLSGLEEVGQVQSEPEASAGSGIAKDEVAVTGTSPNEEDETEEAPLLSPNDKPGEFKK